MRYLPLILIALVLIALDWAALRRIMSGEHGTTGAWITVGVSGLILGMMLGILFRAKQKKHEE